MNSTIASMTPTKAVYHLHRKLSRDRDVSDTDSEAFTCIRDFVVNHHKTQINKYEPFVKAMVLSYSQILKKYKSNVFDPIPQKELFKFLDQPLSSIIAWFTNELNDSEQYHVLEDAGIGKAHPRTTPEGQRIKEYEALETLMSDPIKNKQVFCQAWSYEEVEESIYAMANGFIDKFCKK